MPAGIHLVFQPTYSPERQPAERLWAVTDEALANQWFATIDDLEKEFPGFGIIRIAVAP